MKKIRLLSLCIILLTSSLCTAKNTDTSSVAALLTADSLASGNYKDVMISFYQLAFNNLTGDSKSFHFASNPFAIMLRADSSLKNNVKYLKPINKVLRNINFDIDARLDSNFHFDGFATGVKYAIWNERDKSSTRIFEQTKRMRNDSIFGEFTKAVADSISEVKYMDTIAASYPTLNAVQRDSVFLDFKKEYYRAYSEGSIKFNDLDPLLQRIIKRIAQRNFPNCWEMIKNNPNIDLHNALNTDLSNLISSLATKPLWTISASDTSYKDGSLFKSVQLATEFLKGFDIDSNKIFNMELDIKAAYNFVRDTNLLSEKNLSRQIFSFEPNLNFVLKSPTSKKSIMELKIGGGYYNIIKGQYANEDKTLTTLNGTFRIRVYDEIWIPIDIKYDIDHHNVFGFLNVKTNFQALGKLLSQ